MRQGNASLGRAAAVLGLLLLGAPLLAQYREYYVRGRVLDAQQKPVAGVEIRLVDKDTNRRYDMTTDEKGEFKFAGLPHAVYEVTFAREGYVTGRDEWDLDAPQERMKRVDIADVVLASEAQVEEARRLGETKAAMEEASAAVEEAGAMIRGGDFDGAIAALGKVLTERPDDPNALYFLGLSHAGKKNHAEALGPLTRVTELTPEFPGAWLELGVCHRALGRPDEALAAYDRTLELDPANAHAAYNSGLVLFEQNRIDEALARFQAGLAARPDDAELQEMAGRCYLNQGKLDLALEHLEKARAVTTDPEKGDFLDALIEQTRTLAP